MLSGDNSILQKATDAKERAGLAEIVENAKLNILAQITDNKGGNITKEQLVTILNEYFETKQTNDIPDEISIEHDIQLNTKDGKYTVKLSEIYSGKFSPTEEGKAYAIGDYIEIKGEGFYVIQDSPVAQQTVNLIAAKVIDTDTNKQVNTFINSDSPRNPFGSSTKSYANSSIKNLVESYVASLDLDVVDSRLLSFADLVSMGYPYDNLYDENWADAPEFLLGTMSFWLMDAWNDEGNYVWVVAGNGSYGLGQGDVFDAEHDEFGVRPVIEILKSNLPS